MSGVNNITKMVGPLYTINRFHFVMCVPCDTVLYGIRIRSEKNNMQQAALY